MTASIVVNPDSPAQSACADIFLKKSSLCLQATYVLQSQSSSPSPSDESAVTKDAGQRTVLLGKEQ